VTTETARADGRVGRRRSLAQWFCLLVGPILILVGLLGFLAEAKFDTASGGDPGALDGHDFIIFEVNGWHNVVHIATGLLLLLGAARHALARRVLIVFGVAYAAVSVIGLIDGKDVLGLFPIDKADNVLHIVLAASALAVAFLSTRDRVDDRGRTDGENRIDGEPSRAGAARAEAGTR
jgi:Domain of unknown function (DUF4383)